MSDLTNLQLVAIGGAIKDKELTAAKQGLKVGSENVDVTVRIVAAITKDAGSFGTCGDGPAAVALLGPGAVTMLLKQLGIGPQRLEEALRELCQETLKAHKCSQLTDAEFGSVETLTKVFATVAAEVAAKLPKVRWSSPGKSGATRVTATVTVVEQTVPEVGAKFPRIAAGTEPNPKRKKAA